MWVIECDEQNNQLDNSEVEEPDGASRRRATLNISQLREEGRSSEKQHCPKRRPRAFLRNRTSKSIPDVGDVTLSENLKGQTEEREDATLDEDFQEDSGFPNPDIIRSEEKLFQSTECGNDHSCEDQPQRHPCSRALEKPWNYGENVCQKSNTMFHEGAHMEEKPFECPVCRKCFSRNSLLIKHGRTHEGEKPYNCALCGKGFVYSWNLIKHNKKHTGEKPHKCSYCGKTFFERSDLLRHERTHTGERPYKCSACEKSFSQKWLLLKHERMHVP